MSRRLLPASIVVLLLAAAAHAGMARGQDRGPVGAYRHVLELAGVIGPRKTGTEADRRAIEYIAREMEGAGLEVALEEVAVAPYEDGERSVGSWNVIGRLQGGSRDTVIVAAHHDSHGASVPGANDDASGVAVLLEAARAAARRPHRLTYLFISFCAEEEGLLGSRDFVRRADLSPVRAVLALELVGRGELVVGPVPDPPALWAQELLLRAARETGVGGVASRPLWSLAPRFLDLPFSADHEPFLEQKIPAFLLLGTFPAWRYHTPEDGVNGVRPEALERAVRVVDRILQDLDARPIEARDDPHYLPLMLFGQGILLPSQALTLVSCAALLGWACLALWRLRDIARPRAVFETLRVLIVAGAATGLGLSGLFLSESLMERIRGVRFPWMAHQGLHVAQGVAFTLFTGWIGLKLFRRIKPTVAPGPYLAAAFLVPVLCVALALQQGLPEIAVFMAVPILMFLVSGLFETTGRRLALGLGAAAPFACALTLRDYRTLVDLGGVAPPAWLLFVVAFLVAFPPVLYLAHVASFQDCLHSRAWRWLSGRPIGLGALALSAVLLATNLILPSYDYRHRQIVRVRQRIDLKSGRASAMIRSNDLLRGVRLRAIPGRALDPDATTDRIDAAGGEGRVDFAAAAAPGGEAGETVVTTRLLAPAATDRISYVFSSRSGFRVPGRGERLRHQYTFTEIAPRRNPVGRFRLVLAGPADLSVELRADFDEDLLGLQPEADGPRVFVHRATVEGARHLLTPAGAAGAAAAEDPSGTR